MPISNPTNVCAYRCPLCAFSCDPADRRAYVLDQQQILARAREAVAAGCTELHVVGGVHPQQPFAWYLGIRRQPARGLSAAAPEGLHRGRDRLVLRAYRPQRAGDSREADRGRAGEPARRRGRDLRPRGPPANLPAQGRTPPPGWPSIARPTGWACDPTPPCSTATWRRPAQRIDHLLRLRDLQDETGGFQAFIPLAFHPENTRLAGLPSPSGLIDLRIDRRQPPDAGQLRARQGLLDLAGRGHGPGRPWPTGPTTWTARCVTSGSITRRGPNRPRPCRWPRSRP